MTADKPMTDREIRQAFTAVGMALAILAAKARRDGATFDASVYDEAGLLIEHATGEWPR